MTVLTTLGSIRIPDKVIFWLKIYLLGLAQFALFRLLFLVFYWGSSGQLSFWMILKSFLIGLRFDTVILGVILTPLFLINIIPGVALQNKIVKTGYRIILAILFGLIIFVNSADLGFFEQFGSRMNYWAVEYLDDPYLMLYTITTHSGTLELLLVFAIIYGGFLMILNRIINSHAARTKRGERPLNYLYYAVPIILLLMGIRGRLGIKPLDWGEAFFSENQFVNQMTLNGVYSLSHSLYEEGGKEWNILAEKRGRFHFMDNGAAYKTVREMLDIDTTSGDREYSLVRESSGGKQPGFLPNIVFIIMESWSANRIGAFGDTLGITTHFDSLIKKGMLFDKFYANGVRTNRGIAATLGSFPSLPGRSIMKRFSADYPFMSVAKVLKPFGYTSVFAYGGDIQFDNIEGFLRRVGFDGFYSEKDFGDAPVLGKWGVQDDAFFEQMAKNMDSLPRPFVSALMTLSFHDPFLIPDQRFEKFDTKVRDHKRLNCMYFSDWALGRFIDSVRQCSYSDSTIFIFTADHCEIQSTRYPMSSEYFHIPLLIYAPGIIGDSVTVISKTGSQVDIIPTVLDLLGLRTTYESWGKSLLDNENGQGFAVIVNGNKVGLIEDSLMYFDLLKATSALYNIEKPNGLDSNLEDSLPDVAKTMRKRLHAYLQLAEFLSSGRNHTNKEH